eukprot:TRINITY_DN5035_c0_g2_i2.p1 TRINITY_DN5035_c0_g2~~TRINITY_DN5035_c0_g2_i2.p1  ORF type:complete len:252 (-),score=31.22 TRINITY_DN5035_c0_g2_i2:102-857(-)
MTRQPTRFQHASPDTSNKVTYVCDSINIGSTALPPRQQWTQLLFHYTDTKWYCYVSVLYWWMIASFIATGSITAWWQFGLICVSVIPYALFTLSHIYVHVCWFIWRMFEFWYVAGNVVLYVVCHLASIGVDPNSASYILGFLCLNMFVLHSDAFHLRNEGRTRRFKLQAMLLLCVGAVCALARRWIVPAVGHIDHQRAVNICILYCVDAMQLSLLTLTNLLVFYVRYLVNAKWFVRQFMLLNISLECIVVD